MNSTDAAYRRDNFILTFMDCLCVPDQKDYTQQDICDCNEAITEYECMLQHAIDVETSRNCFSTIRNTAR